MRGTTLSRGIFFKKFNRTRTKNYLLFVHSQKKIEFSVCPVFCEFIKLNHFFSLLILWFLVAFRKMYRESERAAINTNYKFDPKKENLYLDRIARLMGTDRMTLNSYGKIKLWDGPNYQKVVKYVNNSQCHPNYELTVVNIHRVWLHNTEDKNLFHISNRKLLWHGTKRANIPSILNNGFKLPTSGGQMFGTGIYFADRISKSSNYSDLDVTFLLLCEIGLGKVYSCRNSHNNWKSAPVGFDCVKANGTYVPDRTDVGRYMGACIPFGKTAKCSKYQNHAVNYNEFIVYDPSRIIIRFLVEVNVRKVLLPSPLTFITPRNVVAVSRTTKKSYTGHRASQANASSSIKTIAPNSTSTVNRQPHNRDAITKRNYDRASYTNVSKPLPVTPPTTFATNDKTQHWHIYAPSISQYNSSYDATKRQPVYRAKQKCVIL